MRNGQPCIAGTGLRVFDLVLAHLFHRRQPDEIAADYDLSLAHVYAALTYGRLPCKHLYPIRGGRPAMLR
ncbi:MAG: DUF433 domain-containing protein, partial [Caldilinea sp.]